MTSAYAPLAATARGRLAKQNIHRSRGESSVEVTLSVGLWVNYIDHQLSGDPDVPSFNDCTRTKLRQGRVKIA